MSEFRVGIVYDDTIDRFGGIGLYVTTLGQELVKRGHHVEYLLGSSGRTVLEGVPVRVLARNAAVSFNGNALSMPVWSRATQLDEVLARGRFNVLHVQVPYSPLMAGRLLRRCDAECAVVGTFHVASDRFLPRNGARLLRVATRRSDRRFDRMLAVSRTAEEFAVSCSRLRIDQVIPNLLDIGRVQQHSTSQHLPSAEVVFVGRLVPRKGVEWLLRALHAIAVMPRSSIPTTSIIGDGPLRGRLEQLARSLGLTRHVRFHGTVDDRAKAAVLSGAKVACFPSLFGESFGVVVLEALAAGSEVVVAGDNPGYRELLPDSRALVDPRDTAGFAHRLASLLRDHALRQELGQQQQRELLSRSSVDRVTDAVERTYRSALAARCAGDMLLPRTEVRIAPT